MKNSHGPAQTKYDRMKQPPPIRLTVRDEKILLTIYEYGGLLTARHIHQLFFNGKSKRTVERRIATLFHNGYLERPRLHHHRTKAIPESFYWLGLKGILHIATSIGKPVEEPTSDTKSAKKKVKAHLRKKEIYWLDQPHWQNLVHDIRGIDVRLAFLRAIKSRPHLRVQQWINEMAFRSNVDKVSIPGSSLKRGVIPDFFLHFIDEKKHKAGNRHHHVRLLFEIDMANHSAPRFQRQKIEAYARYIDSQAFLERFSATQAHWLVVTTGKKRLDNLQRTIESINSSMQSRFSLSTFQLVTKSDPLTDAIWQRVGKRDPIPLMPSVGKVNAPTLVFEAG